MKHKSTVKRLANPEWLIDEDHPFDAEIAKELKGQGLRGNEVLLALKERRARVGGSDAKASR